MTASSQPLIWKGSRVGVCMPQTAIEADAAAVRYYAQACETLGFEHLLAYDHVLGVHPDWHSESWPAGAYTHESLFHEPLVLFGFLAGITSTIRFVSGVIIGPQRQTALLAKQSAEVDRLSGGRLRLGLGTGWNDLEYVALGMDFSSRGAVLEEQVAVLRELWTKEVVHFEGNYHHIPHAGVNPLPVQQPVPIWLGGMGERVYRRVATVADGWIPNFTRQPDDRERAERGGAGQPSRGADADPRDVVDHVRRMAAEHGRDPADVEIDVRATLDPLGSDDQWFEVLNAWAGVDAQYLTIVTHQAPGSPQTAEGHVALLERCATLLRGA